MPPRTRPHRLLPMLLLFGVFAAAGAAPVAAAQDPAAAAEPTGMLQISSPQPGAAVWVDNEPLGPAPVSHYLTAGEHTIRVAADGYEPFVRKVKVRAGTRASVAAPLSPGGGTVEFAVNAPGGQVSVDGKPPVPTPVRLRNLPTGDHTYTLNAPGFEPVEGSFDFAPGANRFIVAELQSARGRLVVTSEPAGATVQLDGAEVGVTPLELEGVAPGLHLVRVHDGRRPAVLEAIDTSDGSKGAVTAKLDGKGARVIIQTGAEDATVTMSGVTLGAGKKVDLGELARGRYIVEVQAPGRKTASGKVVVPAVGRAAYRADLVAEDARGRSTLDEARAFYEHWAFWTAVGVGAAGATTGAIVAAQGNQPVPLPDGDVSVPLP